MFVPSASHFLSAQKVTPSSAALVGAGKKGTLPPANAGLRKGSAGQRTTVLTSDCMRHYDYSLSLRLQLV
jgi:hypothetical protein